MCHTATITISAALLVSVSTSLTAQRRSRADTLPSCGAAVYSKGLPRADAVIDSARAAAVFASPDTDALGAVAVTIQFARGGELLRLAVIGGSLETDSARTLAWALGGLVRQQAAAADPWGVRLQVRLAPNPAFEVSPSWYCPPKFLRSEQAEGRVPVGDISREEARRVGRGSTITLRVHVGTDGRVDDVKRLGSTGAAALDEEFVISAYKHVYTAPRLDGLPIDAWVDSQAKLTVGRR
jgi:TonB family protein